VYIYILYIFAALWMACGFGFTKQYCPNQSVFVGPIGLWGVHLCWERERVRERERERERESWFLLFKRGKVLYWSFSIVPMTKPRQPIFKSHLGSLVRRKKSFSVDHFCGPSPESAGWGAESYPQAISQKSLGSYWDKGPFTSMISLLKMVIGDTSSYHKLPEAMQTS